MCIADLTGSISTDQGDFNSVELSQSVFQETLGLYNWASTTFNSSNFAVDTANYTNVSQIDVIFTDPTPQIVDLTTKGLQVGMTMTSPGANPQVDYTITGFANHSFYGTSNAAVQLSPNISINEGQKLSFGTTITTCSLVSLKEDVQTKDRDNACVDFLMLFIGSGSAEYSSGHHPQTHIFTDDGFDFAVTGDQEILVWQGGATNQNNFIPAEQLSIGTPLVSWANDIYQYVQVTSMSIDINNSTAVNWTTTGTNSYQLENGIVLRGFVDNYCSCKPSASIDGGDIPCESTVSYCISTSLAEIYWSGSESGGWEGASGTAGTTDKKWSLVLKEGDVVIAPTLGEAALAQRFLTASFTHLSQSSKIEVCYTESRNLGLGVVAKDTCCFELRLNRQPRALFGSTICQSNFGTTIDLEQDVQFIHADTITYTLESGSIGTFSDIIDGKPKTLTLDPLSHGKGKLTLCYTASSINIDCTDNANNIATTTPLSTPNCCPAISGCVDIYFNPGISAGKNAVHCYPTMSLTGTGPIYNFTDTVVSQPTWSLAGATLQYNDYELNPIADVDVDDTWVDSQTFGAISELTNSMATEIHMNSNHGNDNNFGFFTMSLEVSNGPCKFEDFSIQYVAKTFANAGPDRTDCINFPEGGTQNNLPVDGDLIQLQATGSGYWSYVDPNAAYASPSIPVIVEPTKPTSQFRLGHCFPATIQWTHQSSSTVILGGETYSVLCNATDQVTIKKLEAKITPKIVGHLLAPYNDSALAATFLSQQDPKLFTSSFSQSSTNGSPSRGPWSITSINGVNGLSDTDTLDDLHILSRNSNFYYHLAYTQDNEVEKDFVNLHIPTNLPTYPMHIWGGPQPPNSNVDLRMYRWGHATHGQFGDQLINSVVLNNSESAALAGGFLTSSKDFMPTGLNNGSVLVHTSSYLAFSGSSSASFAAPSGSLLSPDGCDETYHLAHITSSLGDCNCKPGGSQGRIFHHLLAQDFRFATHSITGVFGGDGGRPGTYLGAYTQITGSEPALGIDVPIYKDVFAITFMSESTVMGSTGSSVIYTGSIQSAPYNYPDVVINTGAFFITSSLFTENPHHKQNATLGLKAPKNTSASLVEKSTLSATNIGGGPKVWVSDLSQRGSAYPLTFTRQASGGPANFFPMAAVEDTKYPWIYTKIKLAEDSGQAIVAGPTSNQLYHQWHRNPTSGMSDYGFSVTFEWRARETAVYNSLGDVLVHGVDIPAAVITGSFADTMTSESFIEAPTFFPAQRAWSKSTPSANPYIGYNSSFIRGSFGIDGFESGGSGHHVPYYNPVISIHSNNYAVVATQSVMFECTASVKDYNGRLIKQYITSQSAMFFDTSTLRRS